MGVGACNKANADTVKTCLIPIPVYNMCINQHMEQVGKKKLEVLTEIADEVNSKENAKIKSIENDALVVVSDIEGRAKDFLVKLKHTGVIDGVEVDKKTGKLKIRLNENFCGTIDFCGDLTAYKNVQPFGNEIVIEVFEELLAQIKEHNKDKEKDKQIQFVAVPGNHEFYRFWGLDDDKAIYSRDDGGKNPLLIKLKSLKVIAKIQKYFLEQVQKNKDDITDDDYQGTDVKINEKIKSLDKESEMLDTIYNVLSGKGADLGDGFYYDFINYKDRKDELQKEKDCFKNGYFMINTKEGKITNDERTNKNNQFGFKSITKEDLEKIFKDEVCYLPFDEILKILKSNGKYQENSSDDTEWTAELINEKLNDLKKVLKNEDFVFNIEQWPYYKYDLAKQLTAIKNLETKLESFKTTTQELKQQLSQDGYIEQGEIKDENPISVFRPLLWDKSALLSKIVFNHRGKKFRTLHHFGLFVPEGCSVDDLTKDNQKNIFADAFSTLNYFNVRAINDRDLRYLKRDIFENNKIPTLFGHEGKWSPGAQTSEMYCVDTRHCDDLNVVCVVDSKNQITPYYTHKCIELKNEEQKKQNQQNFVKLELGAYDEKAFRTLVECKSQENKSGQQPPKNIVNAMLKNEKQQLAQQTNIKNNLNNLKNNTESEEQKPGPNNNNNNNNNNTHANNTKIDTIKNSNDENLEQTIEDYVNDNKKGQQVVAYAIGSLIENNRANFLEKYSRIFVFSQKDKRAQQVYETYKDIEKNKLIIQNDDSPKEEYKMYRLNDIHAFNTPCGGCL